MENQKAKVKTELKYRAYKYSIAIIEFLDSLPKDVSTTVITKQLLRSATSIGANVVEAKGASSKRDFTNFFSHSLKSANESLYWLGLLRDAKKINNAQLEYLIKGNQRISKHTGFKYLDSQGEKYVLNFKLWFLVFSFKL